MTRIAIVGLNAYPAVNPQASKNVGGLENFAWTFARSLASDPRWQVSLLLRHHRSIPEESLDGVKFVKYIEPLRNIRLHVGRCVRRQEQFPFLKVQIWNWSLLWKIPLLAIVKLLRLKIPHQERLMAMLIESECDVVVALGINADSAAAIHAAKVLGKRVWLWLRSNGDIDERFFADDTFIDPYAVTSQDCRYCVSQVKGILCQTQSQRDRLKEVANRDGVIVRNPVDLARFRLPLASFEERDRVLWLGRMDRFHKRPLLAIEIARQCPDITFEIIANRGDAAVEAEVRVNCPSNVVLRDYVPRSEIGENYRRSRIFLSTGSAAHEGFPNVFLESAACGTPIVSLEDFDGFLADSECGIDCFNDVNRAAAMIRRLWQDRAEWLRLSERGRPYVEQHYSPDACVAAFQDAISESL